MPDTSYTSLVLGSVLGLHSGLHSGFQLLDLVHPSGHPDGTNWMRLECTGRYAFDGDPVRSEPDGQPVCSTGQTERIRGLLLFLTARGWMPFPPGRLESVTWVYVDCFDSFVSMLAAEHRNNTCRATKNTQ